MRKLLLVIVALVVLLSSCNFLPSTNSGELLQAPMMNQMQEEVYQELSKTMDISQVIYRHPIMFYDMDGDDLDEAFVFFSEVDTPKEITLKVLRQYDGTWHSFYDTHGQGSAVDFMEFVPFADETKKSLVVGWENNDRNRDKIFSVYSLSDRGMIEEFTQPYANHLIFDDKEKNKQLLLIQHVGKNLEVVLFDNNQGKLEAIDRMPLYEDVVAVEQILIGTLPDASQVLYFDEEIGGVGISYGTEIFGMEKNHLRVLAGSQNGTTPEESDLTWETFTKTFRAQKFLSRDVNNAGTIVVPQITDQGKDDAQIKNGIYHMDYMLFDGAEFHRSYSAAIHQGANYALYYPERWVDNVIVLKGNQHEELRICKKDPKTGKASTELLRIRMYHSKDYMDEFAKDDILLGTKGLYSYYASIPRTKEEPLAITEEEAREIFSLL